MDLSGVDGEWVAFKVKVPKAGKYVVDVNGYSYKSAGLAEIYMTPYSESMTFSDITANIDTYASSDTFVAEADFNGTAEAPVNYPAVATFVASDAVDYSKGYGEYLMIVKTCRSKKNSSVYYVLLNSIDLIGTVEIDSVEVKMSDEAIGVGESTAVSEVIAKNAAGGKIDLADAYIEHSVAEGSEDIIEISDDGKTFTAIGEGTATIETLIMIEGSVAREKTEITVDDNLRIINAYLYSGSIATVGDEIGFYTRVELNNRKLASVGEIIGFEIVSSSADDVAAISDDGKVVEATGVGVAEIRARVSARGKIFETDTVTITVTEAEINYPANFTIDLHRRAYSGDNFNNLDEVTEYTPYRNWIFHKFSGAASSNPQVGLAVTGGTYALVLFNGVKNTNYLAFKVMFPQAGEYKVDVTGLVRYRATKLEMFVIPANANNEKNLDSLLVTNNEYHFGTGDFYNVDEISDIRSFGTNTIKSAGEYFVVFRTAPGTSSSRDAWYPLCMYFMNSTAISDAELVSESGKTEIEVNETLMLTPKLFTGDGTEVEYDPGNAGNIIWESSNEAVAAVSDSGVVTGINEGKANITAEITYEGVTVNAEFEVSVKDSSGIDLTLGIETSAKGPIYAYMTTKIDVRLAMNSGRWVDIPSEYITYEVVSGAEFAEVSEDGTVTGLHVGSITVQPVIDPSYKEGIEDLTVAPVTVEIQWDAAVDPAVFTLEERENVKRNASRYSWAKNQVDTAVAEADKYVDKFEQIYNLAVPEGLPRWYHVGHTYDPLKFYCRYCGCNIGLEYGSYGWSVNALSRSWKIQCPDCKRTFPSNDFEGFYKLGLSESGSWSYEKALLNHHKKFVCADGESCACENAPHPTEDRMTDAWIEFYGFGKGYLANTSYSEMDEKLGVVGWGVDDSLGYMQPYISVERAAEIAGPGGDITAVPGYDPRYYDNGSGYAWYRDGGTTGPVQHTYIAYYLHEGLWYARAVIRTARS